MWLKRIAAPKWWPIERKTHKFVVVPRGPHKKEFSLPLQIFVRDVIKFADTAKESKKIITSGKILVDGKKRKDINYGIGLMDVINSPEAGKSWRALPKKGLIFVEVDDPTLKICRISNKKILKGKKTQLNLHDGKNIISDMKCSTKDSLVLELPGYAVKEHIEFKEGNLAMVVSGKNAGKVSKIEKIDSKDKRVWLEDKSEVPIDLLMMIGKDKSAVKIE